ncbi:MAG: phosphate ABC transporter ATP-binding protein [Candidatus Omnitrophota bacterium]
MIFRLDNVFLAYGRDVTIREINLSFRENRISCIIGPSGVGKSTLLRTLNRMNDIIAGFSLRGSVLFRGRDIYADGIRACDLRREVGMVFQQPCIFPGSIYDNVLFGLRRLPGAKKTEFPRAAEEALKSVSLWGEVKDRLKHCAAGLSQGQQQRLSIARALAVGPKVLLVDEPTSSLDHRSAKAIEELVCDLARKITVIMVTHKLDQARRIADDVVFVCGGRICEAGNAEAVFRSPQDIETKCYVGLQ